MNHIASYWLAVAAIIFPLEFAYPANDMTGRTVLLRSSVQRIVSLAPSCTEILVGLGLQNKLVGITDHTDEPPEILSLPRVGSYVNLNIEAIAALNPDLILATNDGNPEEALNKLRKLSLPVFVLDLTSFDNIRKSIERTGAMLGRERKALEMSEEMHRTALCIHERTRNAQPLRVLFIYDSYPIVSAGENTFTNELIKMSGALSITSEVDVPYPRLTMEHVIARDPDAVIISSMDPQTDREAEIRWWRQWPMLTAVRNNRIHVLPSKNLDRPSQKILHGFRLLAATLHPQLFANNECR
jgi:iron complex transport system substrate-binding protein